MIGLKNLSPSKIVELLESAFKKREILYPITNAVRLVNGEGDDLPGIAIDRYHEHFMIQVYDSEWVRHFAVIKQTILKNFEVQYLIIKDASAQGRNRLKVHDEWKRGREQDSQTVVMENGLKFHIELNDRFNAGLFLDMRRNRTVIGALCKEKSVLNGFAYTCSFGIYARSFGASKVVNVDISQKYLDRGVENYALSELPSSQDEFVKSDVEKYLSIALKKKNLFDVIILDPPSFSRYEDKTFTVKKAFPKLIDLSLQILKPSGHLFVSTNFSEISTGLLGRWVKGSAEILYRSVKKVIPLGQDKDFPSSETIRESHLAALLVNFK